jgi:hypothetical protein
VRNFFGKGTALVVVCPQAFREREPSSCEFPPSLLLLPLPLDSGSWTAHTSGRRAAGEAKIPVSKTLVTSFECIDLLLGVVVS